MGEDKEGACHAPIEAPVRATAMRWRDTILLVLLAFGIMATLRPQDSKTWLVLTHLKLDAGPLGSGGTGAGSTAVPQLPPAVLGHIAVATHTADHRHELVKRMRGWRRGVQTLVLTNATGADLAREQMEGSLYNERWVFFPDAPPGFSITNKTGDLRAAVAPALAAAHLGSFKWLLVADDDVAFFWGGVLRMLDGLDPADPYLLTDSYYSRFDERLRYKARKQGREFGGVLLDGRPYAGTRSSLPPKPDQPRCLPCTFNDTGLDLKRSHGLKTCQCTVRRMHKAFKRLLTGENQWRDFPRSPPIVSIDGSGGTVFSTGLLSHLDPKLYRSCIAGREGRSGGPTTCGGGDCLLGECIWHQGYGYTDPGFELRHRDIRPGMFLFNGARDNWREVSQWSSESLVGPCSGSCSRLWLDNMVSVHTNAANMSDATREAAQVGRFLDVMALYQAAFEPSLEDLAARLIL